MLRRAEQSWLSERGWVTSDWRGGCIAEKKGGAGQGRPGQDSDGTTVHTQGCRETEERCTHDASQELPSSSPMGQTHAGLTVLTGPADPPVRVVTLTH